MATFPERWYDKTPYLRIVMRFLESASDEVKETICNDIVQLIAEYYSEEMDGILNDTESQYQGITKRWYDIAPNVHSAIELLKTLPEDKREEVAYEMARFIMEINTDISKKLLS